MDGWMNSVRYRNDRWEYGWISVKLEIVFVVSQMYGWMD